MIFDLAIIGAGPAGAMLARLVGNRCRVLLVEPRRLDGPPGGIGKCCGGLLAEQGLGVPRAVLSDPQLFMVPATAQVRLKQDRHRGGLSRIFPARPSCRSRRYRRSVDVPGFAYLRKMRGCPPRQDPQPCNL